MYSLTALVAVSATGTPAAGVKPHIIMHLADDFGWANAGWHRPEGYQEVQTPNMDALVKAGIELDQAYSFKFCSPTRSSLQSGRLPVHVNMVNLGPETWNPADPVSGFAAIPRNMTGIATKLKSAGYKTHQVGKWDAGMATVDHTPHGRGYDTSFGYFHHDNDYWNEHVGDFVDLYNETDTTSWHGPAPAFKPTDGAAYGLNGSCALDPAWNKCGFTGPEEQYEEFKFKTRVLEIINAHDATDQEAPLFLCYTSHIVHEPLQVPNASWHHFDFIGDSTAGDFEMHRQTYHAMVYYMDGVVGDMVDALKAKAGMWENVLWFHQSDNGGPSFTGSAHTANNYPLKGSKMTDWQGGIRVNAFVSGGLLQTAAPHRIGTKLEGFTHVCDWYATWCALAGVDTFDARGAAADLPPVDGVNLWPYLSGQVDVSPRTEVFASPTVLLMEINNTKWKIFGTTAGPDDGDEGYLAQHGRNLPSAGVLDASQLNCSVVHVGECLRGVKAFKTFHNMTDIGECCAKCEADDRCVVWTINTNEDNCLLRDVAGPTNTGSWCTTGQVRPWSPPPPPPPTPPGPPGKTTVGTACWMGPQYPNRTDPSCNATMTCDEGCLYNLALDPYETNNVAAANPDVLLAISERLQALQPSVFSPDRSGGDNSLAAKTATARGGYWGPFIFP